MAYHLFNIGKPADLHWWRQNLYRGVITAGFFGDEGDRGEVILKGMDEGDTVIAYVNGHGFVGAGLVQGAGTYHLHKHLPRGSLSDHLHERKVAWTLAVSDLAQAIKADTFGRQAPRNTKERLPDVDEAERIIEALKANGARDLSHGLTVRGDEIYWRAADAALEEAREEIAAEPVEPITSDHDGRKRVMREIVAREGQGDFREGLLAAYGRRCAVTGCAVEDILEAAHIRPYRGEHTHRTDNGMLLRADIHTLFDKGLIWIDATGRVQLAERLAGSEYDQWRGQELRLPAMQSCRPHGDHLAYHRTTTAGQPE